jgi:hypothetical protein
MLNIIKKLLDIYSWAEFFSLASTLTDKEKGNLFESLTKLVLLTRPEYSSKLKNVWLQREGIPKDIREYLNLPYTDEGAQAGISNQLRPLIFS